MEALKMSDKLKGIIITIITSAILLGVYYYYNIVNADSLVYGQWGDGYKNMYTSAYYIKNDNGAHFTGMNYPYGEHVVFTDNQPIVSWLCKGISYVYPGISNHAHIITTLPIFLSIIAASVIVYLILLNFGLPYLHAALFSTLIGLLSPQLLRLLGHYALGHSIFIPLLIYLLLKLVNTGKVTRYSILLGITTLFFAFVHLYYMAIALFFLASFSFFYYLLKRSSDKEALVSSFKIVSAAIIPFILFKVFMLFTDSIKDRPDNPWGFFAYCANGFSIFTHEYSFAFPFFKGIFPQINNQFEGRGYVGLVCTTTAIVLLYIILFNAIKNRTNYIGEKLGDWQIIFWASLPVLMLAMALPFKIKPLDRIYEMLPMAFKQFRAPGRFAWVFYYVFTITSAVLIYRLFVQWNKQHKWGAVTFLILVYSVWFIDLNTVANRVAVDFKKYSTPVNEQLEAERLLTKLKTAGKQPGDFQALFPLPAFFNGSEKIYIEGASAFDAMRTSLELGLPITCGQMSRTSFVQTVKLARLLSADLIEKDILKEYKNDKPLLMMVVYDRLHPYDAKYIDRGKFLFEDEGRKFFELPLSEIKDLRATVKKDFAANQPAWQNHGSYLSNSDVDNVFVKRFEEANNTNSVFGKGCFYQEHGQVFMYFDTLPNAKDNTWYEISAWVYADQRTAGYPAIYATELDGEHEVSKHESNGKLSVDIYKNWSRVSIQFQLMNKHNRIYLIGDGHYSFYDEVMIRPTEVNVITGLQPNGNFIYNNYAIE